MRIKKKFKNIRTLYGENEPKQVTFAITSHCNMVCTTCSFPEIPNDKRRHVSLKDAKYAIDFLVDNGVRMISITGGEPLLHPHFLDICEHITERGIMISYISTNGTLLTENIAAELSKMNVNIVGLSIDIMDEKGIGVTRKNNIRNSIPKAKKLLDKFNIVTYAGIVLRRHTADVKVIIKTVRDLGFNKVIFSYPQLNMASSYLAARDIAELQGDFKFWDKMVNNILKEKRWNTHIDIFNTRVNLREFLSFYSGEKYTFECPCGKMQFYLDWNLDLYRCLNSNKKYGNLYTLKDLHFEYTPCNACTQQAHRDYASFYHAFKTVKALESAVKNVNLRDFIKVFSVKKNRQALNSLIEGYLGGFV